MKSPPLTPQSVKETECGTWPALLAAALEAVRQGRKAFCQAIRGTRANPGWQKQVRSDDWKLRKLLDKVEKMSSLGKMEQEVEILGALSPEQRTACPGEVDQMEKGEDAALGSNTTQRHGRGPHVVDAAVRGEPARVAPVAGGN